MEKISSEKFKSIRISKGYPNKAVLHTNFCQWLKTHQHIGESGLPHAKVIQRIEHDNQISKKYLELFCKFLDIKPEILLPDDVNNDKNKKENQWLEKIKKFDTGIRHLQPLTTKTLLNFLASGSHKRIYKAVRYDENTSLQESENIEKIINLIDELAEFFNPLEIIKTQSFNDKNNKFSLVKNHKKFLLQELLKKSSLNYYVTKFQYHTFWPFPSNVYQDYLDEYEANRFHIMDDIFVPENFGYDVSKYDDWYLLPVSMFYMVFVASDKRIKSISFDDEAGRRIINEMTKTENYDDLDFLSEDSYEDYIQNGPLFQRHLEGTYDEVIKKIQLNYEISNYIYEDNIDLILENQKFESQAIPFNINDYKENELDFIDRVLKNKNFYKIFQVDKNLTTGPYIKNIFLDNEDTLENKNYHSRLDFLEKNKIKKKFFDDLAWLKSNLIWHSLRSDDEVLDNILSINGLNTMLQHMYFKRDEAMADSIEDEIDEARENFNDN